MKRYAILLALSIVFTAARVAAQSPDCVPPQLECSPEHEKSENVTVLDSDFWFGTFDDAPFGSLLSYPNNPGDNRFLDQWKDLGFNLMYHFAGGIENYDFNRFINGSESGSPTVSRNGYPDAGGVLNKWVGDWDVHNNNFLASEFKYFLASNWKSAKPVTGNLEYSTKYNLDRDTHRFAQLYVF